MFGVSPYLYLLQQQRGFGQSGFGQPALGAGQPEQPEEEPGDPFAPDAAARRRARNQGLTALGMALLEGAPRGDLSGGLARGIAGFQEASTGSFDRDRALALQAAEERRRNAAETRAGNADARASAQETDRDRLADVQHSAATEELAAYRDAQARGQQLRERTGKSAEQMVAEINALAAAHPDDGKLGAMAKRAVGYSLGDDSDVNKLAALHAEMTAEAFAQSDYAEETTMGLGRAREQAGMGFGPVADARRADRDDARADAGLGLERERLGLYRQEVARRGDTATGTDELRTSTFVNEVQQEVDKLIEPTLKQRMSKVGEVDQQKMMDPKYRAFTDAERKAGRDVPMPYIQAPTAQEINDLRRSVEDIAIENVRRKVEMKSRLGGDDAATRYEVPEQRESTGTPAGRARRRLADDDYEYDAKSGALAPVPKTSASTTKAKPTGQDHTQTEEPRRFKPSAPANLRQPSDVRRDTTERKERERREQEADQKRAEAETRRQLPYFAERAAKSLGLEPARYKADIVNRLQRGESPTALQDEITRALREATAERNRRIGQY
jgi:hypothetical protein